MITYVDTSTLVKRLFDEDGSDRADLIWEGADVLASAALIVVEARSALASAHRGGRLTARQHRAAKADVVGMVEELAIVEVTDALIAEAADLAEQEKLRGYDAVHLAAALLVRAEVFSSADADLCRAAERCGLHIANPLAG